MKKHLPICLFCCCLLFSIVTRAQYCGGSGASVCTAASGYTLEGFYPPDDSFPCVTIGVPYDTVLQVHTPPTASSGGITATLNYIIIDTIANLPCGLCWQTGNSSNRINGNATGCVRLKGTTFDAPGIYTLRIIVDANVTYGITLTESDQNLSSQGLHFEVRVKAPDDTCIAVDTLVTGNTASTPGPITAPIISGNTSLCSGASTTLTAGGANYYAYAWSNGVGASSISVNTPGTYTVTVYDNCNSATASVNVVNATITPATITPNGATTFCQGGSVTLNAGSGYSAYHWSNGATSQTINVTQAGNYYCNVTESGCPAPSDTIAVTVNSTPTPAITANGPLTFCAGDSVKLDAGAGYSAYNWSNNATTQTIEANVSGNYSVTVTQNGCNGASNTVTVTASSPTPTLTSSGPTTFCAGGADTLDAGSGYATYAWTNQATTQKIVVTQSGQYTCTVTQSGCSGTSNTLTITVGSSLSPVITASPSFTICTGSTATLNAGSGYTTYQWSTNASTQTIQANTANTYSVTVTQGGCSGSASAVLNVGNFPLTVNVTPAGPVKVCAGTPVTLDAGAGYTSYTWSNQGNTETIQPTATGNYTVTAYQDACSGTATVNVTFNALPQPHITSPGPLAICAGGTVSLDAGAGYSNYSWNNGDNTEVSQVSTAGTYSVVVTDTNNCVGSDSVVVAVSSPPVPVITGTGGGCSTLPLTLSTTGTFNSYLWSNGDTTATSVVTASGNYNVTVTLNGCVGSSNVPYAYTYIALPVEYVAQTQSSDTTTTLQVSPTGQSYQWLSQQTIGGAYTLQTSTSQAFTASCSTVPVYYTAVVNQGGCYDTARAIAVICTPMGIDGVPMLSKFSMAPNPTNDFLNISYLLNEETNVKISIIDLTGRTVMNVMEEDEYKGNRHHEIRVADLAQGIYVLNFATNRGSFNAKFVKQ
jgi:large repetitive protein